MEKLKIIKGKPKEIKLETLKVKDLVPTILTVGIGLAALKVLKDI